MAKALAPKEEGMVIDRSKYDYAKTRMVDPVTGKTRTRTSNGDAVAVAMSHLSTPEQLAKVVKVNKLEGKVAGGVSAFSNPGQYRMNIGNMLRARVKKGEPMVIGEFTIKKLDQKVPPPEGVKQAEQRAKEREKEVGKREAAASKEAATKDAPSRGKKSGSRAKSSGSRTDASASTSQTA